MTACKTYDVGPNFICTQHGTCNGQGQCICDSGWTSRGDFQLGFYDDCDMSILFVEVGSIVLIVSAAITLTLSVRNIVHFHDFAMSTLILPKNVISIFFLFASIMGIIYGAFRLSDPIGNVVGSDIGSSFGLSGFMVFTFAGWAILSVIFGDFLQSASRVFSAESRNKIKDIDATVRSLWWKVALFSLLIPVFIIVANVESQIADTMVICVLVVCTFEVEVIAGMLIVVLGTFNNEFAKYIIAASSVPDGLSTIRFRTQLLYYICAFFFITVGPTMIVIAALEYLRRKFSYFVILFMICCIYPTLGVLIMLMKSKKSHNQEVHNTATHQDVHQSMTHHDNPHSVTKPSNERRRSLLFSIELPSIPIPGHTHHQPKIIPTPDKTEVYAV